jgi:hypothetical protein
MKNVMFSLAFMLIGSFASANTNVKDLTIDQKNDLEQIDNIEINYQFETKTEVTDAVVHDCYYRVINSRGETVGYVHLTDVPNNVSCGSSAALSVAQDAWNNQ